MSSDYDQAYQEAAINAGDGIDPLLLKAQGIVESNLDPKAVNSDTGATGIAQFIPATAKSLGVDPTDPVSSIKGQATLMAQNLKRYGNVPDALSAYHGGTSQANWGPLTKAYVQKVQDTYQHLKTQASANNNNLSVPKVDQDLTPQDDFEKEALGTSLTSAAPAMNPQDDFEKEAFAAANSTNKPAVIPTSVSPSTPTAQAVSQAPALPNLDPVTAEAMRTGNAAQQKAYKEYMDQKSAAARGEAAYGLGDVPRSLARVAAAVAPETYGNVASGINQSLGATLPTTPTDLSNALQSRNAAFQQQYGNDPNASGNRLAGQFVASAPVIGAAGKVVGAAVSPAMNALTRASPEAAQWLAQSSVGQFMLGKVASNAVVDPLTGKVVQSATLGNKALQYGASGLRAAEVSPAVTATTNASSDKPLGKQAVQNALVSAGIGAGLPAVTDAGTSAVNWGIKKLAAPVDEATQAAQNILQKIAGGDVGKLDTTEYVPGNTPTLPQAAVENHNLAAANLVLKEANSSPGQLVIPELADADRVHDTNRRTFWDGMAKTPQDMQIAEDARDASDQELLYGKTADPTTGQMVKTKPSVWEASTKPTDVKPVVDTIDTILSGPDRKNKAVASALNDVKSQLVNQDGTLESDPETLYRSVIKNINTMLGKKMPADIESQNAQAAATQMLEVKKALNKALVDSTPGYQTYLTKHAQLSQPIDEMNILQNKVNVLDQPGSAGVPTLAKVNKALTTIQKNPAGFDPYKSVSSDTVNKLQLLQKDLQREQNPNKLLRIFNSPTEPKAVIRGQLDDMLGTANNGKYQTLGRNLGAASGAGIGGFLGSHVGPMGTEVGTGAGAALGADVGTKVGSALDKVRAGKSDAVKNKLIQMMLDPKSISNIPARPALVPSFGQLPQLQNALTLGAPYAASVHNQSTGARQ